MAPLSGAGHDSGPDYSELERRSAENLSRAARAAGVRRIIYLGALAQVATEKASQHIASRRITGDGLRSQGVPVTEFRASVVIGAGSMPFEAVRALVERLPIMITPRWVRKPLQPIAASDLVRYLLAAAQDEKAGHQIYEIGGEDVITYAAFMSEYAAARGLKRFMIPVPVITPRLSSLWLKLVTPAHYRIGRRIVDSAEHSSVVEDPSAERQFGIAPMSVREAIAEALELEREALNFLEFRGEGSSRVHKTRLGTRFVERRSHPVNASQQTLFSAITSIGGSNGWFWGDWLWKIRGGLDRLIGGPGLRRHRSSQDAPEVGDIIDFWTVVRVVPGERITFRADMRLPGEAWLDLKVRGADHGSIVDQTVAFDARGVVGIAYWFTLYPLHVLVFQGMLKGIAARSSRAKESGGSS